MVSKRWKPKRVLTKETGSTYLVTGGHGALGSHIVEALLARGETKIRVFDIAESTLFKNEKYVAVIIGNIGDSKRVSEACNGVDVVFHTAGYVDYSKRLSHDWEKFYKINVLGTQILLNACIENNVKKFIHTSSISVFEAFKNGGRDTDDSAPIAEPPYVNHYSHSKVLSEREVLSYNGKSGMLTAAVRPVGMFGPRDQSIFGQIYKNKPKAYFSLSTSIDLAYIENIVHGMLLLEEKLTPGSDIAGEAFILGNGPTPTADHFWVMMCNSIGVKPGIIPFRLAYAFSFIIEGLQRITNGKLPRGELSALTPAGLHLGFNHNTYSFEKARKMLSYEPIYTLDDGLQFCSEFAKGLPGL